VNVVLDPTTALRGAAAYLARMCINTDERRSGCR